MTILTINTGTSANKGDGDSLRTAFHKINLNFAALSTATSGSSGGGGGGSVDLGHISITNSTISTTVTNESIIFDPNGAGKVRFKNTPIQFDNGFGGNQGAGSHILYTKGGGNSSGLGIDATNSSLRIVGDKDLLGTLVDMGLYTGPSSSWASKVLVDYQGNVSTQGSVDINGDVTVAGSIYFGDGSIQTKAAGIAVSYITTGTVSNEILDVRALRFDTEAGFDLVDLGSGAVQVGMNSTFKFWEIAGQQTLIAEGLDRIEFIAGDNITITTDPNGNPKSIRFDAGANVGMGNLLISDTTIFPSSADKGVTLANTTSGTTSYLTLPSYNDAINPTILSSPNELRITTEANSPNPITISPNGDGLGPGYIVIGCGGPTSSANVYLFSAMAEINLWGTKQAAREAYGPNAGTLDLYTLDDGDISIRPNGTGTTIITSVLDLRKTIMLPTDGPGGGAAANALNYQTTATPLDLNHQIHRLGSSDYYCPDGREGQIIYFIPDPGATGATSRVWFNYWLSLATGQSSIITGNAWYPFSSSITRPGVAFAIFSNGRWAPSHCHTS